ncbi:MAG: cation:proton antiporter [Deltaproteobacteria bacterium]|nr:cation:proton antiporter [Deltaproteobacteria bacterium]
MEGLSLLKDIAVIFAMAVAVVLLLGRLNLPSIAGYLIAGVVLGPNGLGLVKDIHAVETLAEVGVVVLLFTIGLEFSLERLKRIWRMVMIGGGLQVGATTAATAALLYAGGSHSLNQGVFFGFLVALSSTAIVLKILAERNELNAPHGRLVIGVLIFQDLCVVPIMLILPMLGGGGGGAMDVFMALGKAALVVSGVWAASRLLVPPFLGLVARQRKRELFLLSVLLVVIVIAWATSLAGLSLALGAFLAGVVLADSDYAHQALADILPFRDTFSSLFFISVGMLLNPALMWGAPLTVLMLFIGVLLLKFVVSFLGAMAMQFPARVAIMASMGLAQVGEFSFVLALKGKDMGLMNPQEYQLFLAATVLTMLVTPLLVRMAPHFAAGMTRMRNLEHALGTQGADEEGPDSHGLKNHAVIIGYGLGGKTLAKAFTTMGIPYAVLDLNPETVREERKKGVPIYYGDASSPEVLAHMRVHQAREVVLAINDPDAALRSVAAIRQFDRNVSITVRAQFLRDTGPLKKHGASDVVVMELESGIEMMARVMRRLGIPRNMVAGRIAEVREEIAKHQPFDMTPHAELAQITAGLRDIRVDSYLVGDHDWVVGKKVIESKLREVTQVSIVALNRGGEMIYSPRPQETILAHDAVYVIGGHAQVTSAMIFMALGFLPEHPEFGEQEKISEAPGAPAKTTRKKKPAAKQPASRKSPPTRKR